MTNLKRCFWSIKTTCEDQLMVMKFSWVKIIQLKIYDDNF